MNRTLEKYKGMASIIADEAGVKENDVTKVLDAIGFEMNKCRREKNPPPPPGSIFIGKASRKYKIPGRTISRWVQKGLIPIILRTKRYKYIDEEKLITIVNKYRSASGQGKHTIKMDPPNIN